MMNNQQSEARGISMTGCEKQKQSIEAEAEAEGVMVKW